MKKRVLSSLKTKDRASFRRERAHQRRKGGSSVVKKRAVVSSRRQKQVALATLPIVVPAIVSAANTSIASLAQTISSESGLPKIDLQLSDINVVKETSAAPMSAWATNQSQSFGNNQHRLAMWAGVAISMVAIFVGWAWTLRYSLNVPVNVSSDALSLRQTENSLTDLFQQVNRSLDNLQAPQPVSVNLSPPSSGATGELNSGEIELLKKKLEERVRSQELSKDPAAVK